MRNAAISISFECSPVAVGTSGICRLKIDQSTLHGFVGFVFVENMGAASNGSTPCAVSGKALQAQGIRGSDLANLQSRMLCSKSVAEFKSWVADKPNGILLDIDETLSATNVAWFDRLVHLFGNPPENLSVEELIQKYSFAQNVPHWQTKEASAWMQSQRDSKEAQQGLPLIPGAVDGVAELSKMVLVLGYLTVRPVSVVEPTIEWLEEHGSPAVPVIAKPNDVPFNEGNQWKGKVLNELYPYGVKGTVDDKSKVSIAAGESYPGTLLLFGPQRVHQEPSMPSLVRHGKRLWRKSRKEKKP